MVLLSLVQDEVCADYNRSLQAKIKEVTRLMLLAQDELHYLRALVEKQAMQQRMRMPCQGIETVSVNILTPST